MSLKRSFGLAAIGLVVVAMGVQAQVKLKPGMVPAPPPLAAPPPANEPAEVARLRLLLGPNIRLSYGGVAQAGGETRLSRAELRGSGWTLTADEVVVEGQRADGFARMVARGVSSSEGQAASLELVNLTLSPGGFGPESLRLDRLAASGLRLGRDRRVELASLTLNDYRPGQEARLVAEGLTARPDGTVQGLSIRRIAAAADGLPGLIASLMQGVAATPPQPREGRLSLQAEGLELRGAGNARLGGMESLDFRNEYRAGQPAAGRLALNGLEMGMDAPGAELFRQLGYRELRADASLDATQNLDTGRFELGTLAFAVRDAAAIGLALTLDGVRSTAVLGQTDQVALVAARLRYADQSLYTRYTEMTARERRITPEALRREWAEMAATRLADRGPGQTMAPIREAVQRFINGQAREIELALRPPRPLNQRMMEKPPADAAGWQRLLGLTVTAR